MHRDIPILFTGMMVRALIEGRKTQTRRLIKRARVFGTPETPAFTLAGDDLVRAFQGASRWRRLDGDGWFWEADAFDWQAPATRTGWMAHIGYAPGDRLWVREAWRVSATHDETAPRDLMPRICTTLYEAGGSMGGISKPPKDRPRPAAEYVPDPEPARGQMPEWAGRLRASMHMPRWASRLTLVVTDVRVERLQSICEADAEAEGVERDSDGWRDYEMPATQCCAAAAPSYRTLWNVINGPSAWDKNPWVAVTRFEVHRANIDTIRSPA